MYSPQLADDLVRRLYIEAKKRTRPMTKILNEIVLSHFSNDTLVKYCTKCGYEIEVDLMQNSAFCEHCESEVFVN